MTRFLPPIAGSLLSLSLLATPARAQAPAADALFEQGKAAMEKGDVETACARFRESDRLDPQPGTRANLGNCEEKRGRVATAWEAFRTALDKVPPGDSRVAYLQGRVKALEPRLPKLTLVLAPGVPAETTVREGETTIGTAGTFGVALPFDPGVHHLTVRAPGHAPRPLDVTLAEGKTTTVTVDVGAPDAASSVVGPAVLFGIGGAALIAGLGTGIVVLKKQDVADAHCSPATLTCSADGKAAANAGRVLGPVTTASLAVGAAAVAAGAIWLGIGRSRRASVGFSPAPGGALARVEATW